MGYREELANYINDITGLVGYMPNSAGYSSGNPLVETAVAYVLLKKLDCITDQDRASLIKAFESCKITGGFFSKLPKGLNDISHDDIIGIVAADVALNGPGVAYTLQNIVFYGEDHNWVLSSTGEPYWDAYTKPWHKAFYKLAVGENPGTLNLGLLFLYIVSDALFNKTDSSDKKLLWLMLESIKRESRLIDVAYRFWYKRLKSTWGSVKQIMTAYYGPSHIFTRYCPE